jgi:hypothetical protein
MLLKVSELLKGSFCGQVAVTGVKVAVGVGVLTGLLKRKQVGRVFWAAKPGTVQPS